MKRLTLLAAGLLVTTTVPVGAQGLTADLRAVAATPGKLAGTELDMGVGFGVTVAWRVQPHLHVYGGWDWLHFGSDNSFAGSDRDFEETGYTFGLRFEHPLGDASRLLYRVDAGGTYKHVEIEDVDGDIIADSKHGLGYEAGLGLLWPAGDAWRFGPTIRFRSLSPDFDINGVTTSGTLRYVGLEMGVSRRF